MKFRDHRGSLAESLETTCYIRDRRHLIEILRERLLPFRTTFHDEDLRIAPYGVDDRGWGETHIVTIEGHGVAGFTDGPLTEGDDYEPAVRFREHSRSLTDSFATVRGVRDRSDLVEHVRRCLKPLGRDVPEDAVRVKPFPYEETPGWNTHIVMVDGYGVAGFLSGPLP